MAIKSERGEESGRKLLAKPSSGKLTSFAGRLTAWQEFPAEGLFCLLGAGRLRMGPCQVP